MVRLLLSISILSTFIFANTFTTNCLSCHNNKKELKLFMANYTLKYSSERNIKNAIFRFLNNPTSYRSIMPYYFIKENGYKSKSNLNDTDLKKAIDIYYKKYKINNFIK